MQYLSDYSRDDVVCPELRSRSVRLLADLMVALLIALGSYSHQASAAVTQKHYYAHDAVEDSNGVIAPWYKGLNGPCDMRIRIAAETMKRYPWTTPAKAPAQYPE